MLWQSVEPSHVATLFHSLRVARQHRKQMMQISQLELSTTFTMYSVLLPFPMRGFNIRLLVCSCAVKSGGK